MENNSSEDGFTDDLVNTAARELESILLKHGIENRDLLNDLLVDSQSTIEATIELYEYSKEKESNAYKDWILNQIKSFADDELRESMAEYPLSLIIENTIDEIKNHIENNDDFDFNNYLER